MALIKKLFIHSPFRYLACLIIIIGVMVLYNIFNGWGYLINYSNLFFISGVIIISVGFFSTADYLGFFNIARYMFVRKNPDGTKKSLYDYNQERTEKIKPHKYRFCPYYLIGIISIIVATIILIINSSIR